MDLNWRGVIIEQWGGAIQHERQHIGEFHAGIRREIIPLPQTVIDSQSTIGADIIMAFDECPPYSSDHFDARTSME